MYYHNRFLGTFWLIGVILAIIPFWRICRRAGLQPLLSLLIAIPLVNLIFIYYLAFTDWPSLKAPATPGGT
jgi:hypothetical protein